MDAVDVSRLSKKERKKLKREIEQEERAREKGKGKLLKWFIIGILVVFVGLGVWWVMKESSKPLPGQAIADFGRKHIPKAEWEKFKYNSNPPTSGPHDPEWVRAGVYDTPQGEGNLVHSLEHGYIIISYNCMRLSEKRKTQSEKQASESAAMSDPAWNDQECKDLKKTLSDFAKEQKLWKLIVVPRMQLDVPIALTAWTRIAKMEKLDKNLTRRFIDAYRGNGPEKTMEP